MERHAEREALRMPIFYYPRIGETTVKNDSADLFGAPVLAVWVVVMIEA